jgi:hypothetical protein
MGCSWWWLSLYRQKMRLGWTSRLLSRGVRGAGCYRGRYGGLCIDQSVAGGGVPVVVRYVPGVGGDGLGWFR